MQRSWGRRIACPERGHKLMKIILQILPYIINICSGCILAVCTYHITRIRSEKQEQAKKEDALEAGV